MSLLSNTCKVSCRKRQNGLSKHPRHYLRSQTCLYHLCHVFVTCHSGETRAFSNTAPRGLLFFVAGYCPNSIQDSMTPCIHHSWYKIEMTHLVVLLAQSCQTCICLALTTIIGRHLLRMTWALLMCFQEPGGFASLHVATKELWMYNSNSRMFKIIKYLWISVVCCSSSASNSVESN